MEDVKKEIVEETIENGYEVFCTIDMDKMKPLLIGGAITVTVIGAAFATKKIMEIQKMKKVLKKVEEDMNEDDSDDIEEQDED